MSGAISGGGTAGRSERFSGFWRGCMLKRAEVRARSAGESVKINSLPEALPVNTSRSPQGETPIKVVPASLAFWWQIAGDIFWGAAQHVQHCLAPQPQAPEAASVTEQPQGRWAAFSPGWRAGGLEVIAIGCRSSNMAIICKGKAAFPRRKSLMESHFPPAEARSYFPKFLDKLICYPLKNNR
jgi:hypothetical protein